MYSTKLDRILAKIEYFVAWALVAVLSVIGLGIIPTKPVFSCFYLAVAWIIYPHNSIPDHQKLIIVFLAFLVGIWSGLI
ncbi:hypothetical protein G7B40_024985 [Aetokthonos hydrillicola Thurmond2011]|jgi:hypothetical protein|uniref:Uncharacterized protein n=1 Tax=Aetokthonos hydrillicola Thurmond2011 TaxID=2712845 RepID=A0AAP5IDN2_9CYAN|nr:hypothetical protein [Aetokthonos hydrillicola]MBO3458488.1 hypothetical protein [Aetokthonos hydrillicola CCALA 1050]MBW4586185.1 hypothetical protein [Aetokthonos hydrillicola CCALA 1050]MDR9897793.1 hypothetical protein [Aetokthonos hydrillicola Thurmond2011]